MKADINRPEIRDRKISPWLIPARFAYRMVKRMIPDTRRLIQLRLNGITFLAWANEDVGKKMLLLRSYEARETEVLRRHVRGNDICFDVGGNIGYYSLNFSRWASDGGMVHVFEPIRRNALMVELASELNGFTNLSVHQLALSEEDGIVAMSGESTDSAYAYMNRTTEVDDPNNVSAVTLDHMVKRLGIPRVDVMKVDVEGGELCVLKGATELLANTEQRPRIIMVELASAYLTRFDTDIDEVVSFLRDFGYVAHIAGSSGNLEPFTPEVKNTEFNVFFLPIDGD